MGRTNSVREMIICLVHFKASVIGHSAEADGGQVVCWRSPARWRRQERETGAPNSVLLTSAWCADSVTSLPFAALMCEQRTLNTHADCW